MRGAHGKPGARASAQRGTRHRAEVKGAIVDVRTSDAKVKKRRRQDDRTMSRSNHRRARDAYIVSGARRPRSRAVYGWRTGEADEGPLRDMFAGEQRDTAADRT